MSKVNWEARNDYEYVNNYKVLQTAFNKLNIEKKAEVEKLCRGKYQDNLEFMQWFKGFLDRHAVAEGYDPVAARAKGKAHLLHASSVSFKHLSAGERVPCLSTLSIYKNAAIPARLVHQHTAAAPVAWIPWR